VAATDFIFHECIQGICVFSRMWLWNILLFHQTGSGDYPVGKKVVYPGGKAAEA
jgi:hypothetical protein